MLVIDTSAALAALVAEPRSEALVERLGGDGDLHAPHLIDVELLHALRRLVIGGDLTPARADAVREDFGQLVVVRYPHVGLADRMWELRDNLTAYDAAFVALSELLAAPLVTVDRRLASAAGHRAVVEVF